MHKDLTERYIRTKRKIRKIVTYKENNCALRQLHEQAVRFIRSSSYPSLFAKAYTPHRGIFENAKAHLYNDIFIKIDIKDFFNSINHRKLSTQLYIELNKVSPMPISRVHCDKLVEIASCGYPGLPLGLVTSPDLANLYLKGFDSLLYAKIKKYGLSNPIYTRYADDLIISFKYTEEYRVIAEKIISEARTLLKEYYLRINDKKTQIVNLNISNHVKITGINVIKKEDNWRHITVGKKLKNELFWKAIHYYDYPDDTTELDVERLKGMLSFVMSIEKEGLSSAYSDGMLQLVQDRGYRSINHLIESLPRRESLFDYDPMDSSYSCEEESMEINFSLENNSCKTVRFWAKDVTLITPNGKQETLSKCVHIGTLEPHSSECGVLQLEDSLFEYYYLTPYDIENNPHDPQKCCSKISFSIVIDYNEERDAEKSSEYIFTCDEFEIEGDFGAENKYHTPDPNNFTPQDVLYIYKGNIRCHRYGHHIIQATAILHNKTDNEVQLNVEYCTECKKFILEYTVFEQYRNRYGVLIGNFKMVVNGEFDGEYDLAKESPLMLSGYNVSQRDGYTSRERHYILARIIHDGIMDKGEVIRYLSYFIHKNGAKPGNEVALAKWEEDLAFVQEYDISTQPKTIISDIRRY